MLESVRDADVAELMSLCLYQGVSRCSVSAFGFTSSSSSSRRSKLPSWFTGIKRHPALKDYLVEQLANLHPILAFYPLISCYKLISNILLAYEKLPYSYVLGSTQSRIISTSFPSNPQTILVIPTQAHEASKRHPFARLT